MSKLDIQTRELTTNKLIYFGHSQVKEKSFQTITQM